MCIIPIFKDKSFTVVSSLKEDSYSEPAIRRVEMPCSPEHTKPLETRLFYRTTPIFCFYAQIICNHAPLLCTYHLQNCYHGFIFWELKRTVSLRWYYIRFSWKHLKRIYRFLFCVFKDISFTVAPLDFWNSCKRLQIVKALFTTTVLYLGCSKEPSHWDGSFEYSQDIYWLKTFKVYILISFLRFKDVSFTLVTFDFWNSCIKI